MVGDERWVIFVIGRDIDNIGEPSMKVQFDLGIKELNCYRRSSFSFRVYLRKLSHDPVGHVIITLIILLLQFSSACLASQLKLDLIEVENFTNILWLYCSQNALFILLFK